VEWLGSIPSHWVPIALRWVSSRYAGGTPDRANDAYWDEGTVPWINSGAVNQALIAEPSALITEAGYRNSSAKYVPEGALVMALAGQGKTKGMVAQTAIKTTCNQSMAAIIPGGLIRARYLYWLLDAQYLQIRNMAGGEARDGLNLDILGAIPCLIPLPEEQQSIADFLDRETTKLDTLVGKKRALIEKLKEKRAALISRTVTRGLPPDAARAAGLDSNPKLRPSGVEWLGDVPDQWAVDRIKWSTLGTTNGIWGDEPDGVDDIICVRVADFDRDNFTVMPEPPTLRAVGLAQRKGRLLKIGDLLIEKSGGGEKQLVGCVVYFSHQYLAVCSNFVARMPVASGMHPRFWVFVHAAIYAGRLNYPAIRQTTGIQNLDSSEYLETRVVFPNYDEQLAIANFLDLETEKIDSLIDKVKTAIDRLLEYRSALITAAVTGKIDVRGAAPGP